MKQADCFFLAKGSGLLDVDVQVRDLNETLRLGLLEHHIHPLLIAAVYLLANPEKLGLCIVKIQRRVRAAIALKPSDEILEMCWKCSGTVCRRRLVRRYK